MKAFEMYQRLHGEEHERIAECYSYLGLIHFHFREYTRAIECFQKAMDIDAKFFVDDHPNFAYDHYKLAILFSATDKNDDAMSHYQAALEVSRKSLPDGHPLTVELLYVIGKTYRNQDDATTAEHYFQEQIELLENSLIATHPVIEIKQAMGNRIHYLCPQCRHPVWVYNVFKFYRGLRCRSCLKDSIICRSHPRIFPAG